MNDRTAPGYTKNTCPRCGEAVFCGARTGHCWCMDFPQILPLSPGETACLCPDCLAELLRQGETREMPTPR